MGTVAPQITSLTIVYTTVYSDADQSKHQSSASLAFVCGIHRRPVNSPHKWPVTRKMFPFDDIMLYDCASEITLTYLGDPEKNTADPMFFEIYVPPPTHTHTQKKAKKQKQNKTK